MTDVTADEIIRHQSELLSEQANFRRFWDDCAYYVMPEQASFLGQPAQGLKRHERQFNSKPGIANDRFGAAVESMLTPQSSEWAKLSPMGLDLSNDQQSKTYLDDLNELLFTWRYRPMAGFQTQTQLVYASTGCFGNGVLFIDAAPAMGGRAVGGARYRCLPMQGIVWATDHTGQVDTVYRQFELQNRQAVQKFLDNTPSEILKQAQDKPFAKTKFIHCVRPNGDYRPGRVDRTGMRFESTYVSVTGQSTVERGGYKTFPFAISRYAVAPGEDYGRGPAMKAYAAIRTSNSQKKTILRGGEKAVDPPMLLHEEGVLEAFNQRSGAANYGMLTADGTALAQPLKTDANIPLGMELLKEEQADIDDAFLVSLFQFLSQTRGDETAEEVRARQAQTATMLAPTMGRMQAEFLGPLIECELSILADQGILPPPPKQLRSYQVTYKSPMAQNMRLEEASAIMDTVQAIGVLSQVDPDAGLIMDVVAAAREIAEIRGVPAKLLLTDEQIAEKKQQRQDAQQATSIAESAPGLSKAALNLAQAGQASGASGGSPALPAAQ